MIRKPASTTHFSGCSSSAQVRLGVVGFGKMGILHSAILSTLPHVRLVAIFETQNFSRRLISRFLKEVEVLSDIEELGDMQLDAVYVTTPTKSHLPIVKTVLSRNIALNIFVEKPLGANGVEACEAVRMAKSANATMVGYQKRYSVTFRKGLEILQSGAIGRSRYVNAYAYSSDILTRRHGWRFSKPAGGGVLRDLGCHLIDLLMQCLGDIRIVSASEKSIYSENAEDFAQFAFETEEGSRGQATISWSNPDYRLPEFGINIVGTNGSLTVTDDEVSLISSCMRRRWYRHDLTDQVPYLLVQSEYTRESEHFISCVDKRVGTDIGFDEAAKIDTVIDLIDENAAGASSQVKAPK